MLISGILNPNILSLLARIRHTNALVVADRGFPFWPELETIDISLVDNIPSVPDLVRALRANANFTQAFMASEFLNNNEEPVRQRFAEMLEGIPTTFEHHAMFKARVPGAIGLIRTGETVQYANVLLVSG